MTNDDTLRKEAAESERAMHDPAPTSGRPCSCWRTPTVSGHSDHRCFDGPPDAYALDQPVPCGHDPRGEPMTTRAFTARLSGRCRADCGEPIEPGDRVAYVDDLLVHSECTGARDADWPERLTGTRPRASDICPTCNLAMPCDCEGVTR